MTPKRAPAAAGRDASRKGEGQAKTKGQRRPGPKRVTPPQPAVGPPPQDLEARTSFFEQARQYAPYLGVEAHGATFVVATTDRHLGKRLFVKRGRPEFRVLARAVRVVEILVGDDAVAGRVFVDVGANIGTSTVLALLSHRFGSAVSCESEEENHRLLRANLALNDLERRVRPLPVAVSNRVGGRAGPPPEAEAEVREIDLVTLDRLAETGVIDADRVGMLWIDAEGHEGHILEGAGALADRGVPIVFELHPAGLDERGDIDTVHEVAQRCYTHFVDVRRQEADRPRFQLRSVSELSRLADRFRDPSIPGHFTDLLLLRLNPEQASVGADLPQLFAKHSGSSRSGRSAT